MNDGIDDALAQAITARVREELARRRISRQALADMARISISTLEKALAGRRAFTLATVIRLEEALGARLRPGVAAAPPQPEASEALGGYSRSAVRWLERSWLTLRPSFGRPGDIFAYSTRIVWDPDQGHLIFAEAERMDSDFAQRGVVSLPHQSGHVYLVTNVEGQHRLAVLCRPTIKGAMYGVLTTLAVGHGSQLVPAATPLVLLPIKGDPPAFGRIPPEHPAHAAYRAELDGVASGDFARFPA